MPYQILHNDKDGFVQVAFSGMVIKEDHYAALDAAVQLCREKETTKLLVDFSDLDTSQLSTMEVYSLGELVAKIKQIHYIAHVIPTHSKARESIVFASNVEANRGMTTREFENLEDAIAWLRGIE